MSDQPKKLFVVISHSTEHELSSVGFTIANGGLTSGLSVSIFLTSGGVDLVRKGAADLTEVKPLEPLKSLIEDFMSRGGTLYACTPCVKSRGYTEEDLLPGTIITGASVLHNAIKEGAATLSF
ncbi:MAG: DsrE family protein [Myxococcota bacterium]